MFRFIIIERNFSESISEVKISDELQVSDVWMETEEHEVVEQMKYLVDLPEFSDFDPGSWK